MKFLGVHTAGQSYGSFSLSGHFPDLIIFRQFFQWRNQCLHRFFLLLYNRYAFLLLKWFMAVSAFSVMIIRIASAAVFAASSMMLRSSAGKCPNT